VVAVRALVEPSALTQCEVMGIVMVEKLVVDVRRMNERRRNRQLEGRYDLSDCFMTKAKKIMIMLAQSCVYRESWLCRLHRDRYQELRHKMLQSRRGSDDDESCWK